MVSVNNWFKLKPKKKNRLIKIIIITIISLLVVSGVTIGILILTRPKIPAETGIQMGTDNPNDIANYTLNADYEGGQSVLDSQLAVAKDKYETAEIYLSKSSLALNFGLYDEAYLFAQKSEEANPTVTSAKLMGAAAAKRGDNADAIEKYKLAISRITGDTEQDQTDRDSIQRKIDELS